MLPTKTVSIFTDPLFLWESIWENAERIGKVRLLQVLLGAHVMEQPSNLTEARSVVEQVHVEHDVQSDNVLRYDADRSATDSCGAPLLEREKVLL